MSKHTPGPWRVSSKRTLTEHGLVTNIVSEQGHEAYAHPGNEHLVAAAPDLLAALQEYARLTSPEYEEGCKRGEHLYPDVDLAVARKAALAAIARATGGDHE